MIQKNTSYDIKCDVCGASFCGPSAKSHHEAVLSARKGGWDVTRKAHLCPECTTLTKKKRQSQKRLGDFVALLLNAHHLTQEQLAKELNCSPSKLNDLLCGRRKVTNKTADKLQNSFGIPSIIFRVWQAWEGEVFGTSMHDTDEDDED